MIYSETTVQLSEVEKDPGAFLSVESGNVLRIGKGKQAFAYLLHAPLFEKMLEHLDDSDLIATIRDRDAEVGITVNLSDL